MINRLKQYIEFKGMTIAQFERALGLSNGALAKAIRNNTAIGSDKLENILMAHPDISPMWLLKGQGEMLLQEGAVPTKQETAPSYLLDMLTQKDNTIREQAKEIGRLEQQVADLTQRLEKTAGDVSIGDIASVG